MDLAPERMNPFASNTPMLDSLSYPVAILALLAPQDRPAKAKPTSNPVIAKVGTHEIRLAELVDEVQRLIPLTAYHRRIPPERMEGINREALDKVIVKHLIHLDAVASGLDASAAEVRKEFGAALEKAGAHYARMNSSQREKLLSQLRPSVARRVLIQKNEARHEQTVPKVTTEMVKEIYEERVKEDPTAFMSPKEAHLYHIFVKLDPTQIRTEKGAKKAKIEAALAELRSGKSFSTVARIYSEGEFASKGGDLGFQGEGSFRMTTLNEYAFKLEVGKTSEVIRSLHGYHILYCVETRPPTRIPFEKMRPTIEMWLNKEHAQAARGRWLAKLRSKFPVDVLRPELLKVKGAKNSDKKAPKTPAEARPVKKS